MGQLAYDHGFYGSGEWKLQIETIVWIIWSQGWDDSPDAAMEEAGEAIPVSDKHETWYLIILHSK